uniref:Uncharacterized protein n=1 Tax=Vitis vinifera TaxID=29760 RepID=F6HB37_VITVI
MVSCVRLNHLVLNKNQLTGQIPPQLGQLYWIKDLNVANNRLSGPVPTFVSYSALPESYANNKGLCGGPLKACEEQGKAKDSFKSGFAVGWAVSAVSVTAAFPCSYVIQQFAVISLTRIGRIRRKKDQT